MRLGIILGVLAISAFGMSADFWRSKNLAGLVAVSLFSVVHIAKKTNWLVALNVLWPLLSAFYLYSYPESPYASFGKVGALSFDALSAQSAVTVLVVTLGLSLVKKRDIESMLQAFSWLCLLDSLYVVYQALHGLPAFERGGFFGNHSMNASVIAMTYPILCLRPTYRTKDSRWAYWDLFCVIAPIVAIATSGSSVALGAFAVGTAAHIFALRSINSKSKLGGAVSVFLITVLIGYSTKGSSLFFDSGRSLFVSESFTWFFHNANTWLGTGSGSYFLFGPHVRLLASPNATNVPIWMHCDWLQIFFEQGLIGLILAGSLFGLSVYKSYRKKQPWMISALCALGFSAVLNYPLRVFVPSLFTGFLILFANQKERPTELINNYYLKKC